MSGDFMQMGNSHELEDEMLPEYDFSKMKGGVRGKYVERVNDLRTWVAQLPKTKLSLSDEACDRGSIYE